MSQAEGVGGRADGVRLALEFHEHADRGLVERHDERGRGPEFLPVLLVPERRHEARPLQDGHELIPVADGGLTFLADLHGAGLRGALEGEPRLAGVGAKPQRAPSRAQAAIGQVEQRVVLEPTGPPHWQTEARHGQPRLVRRGKLEFDFAFEACHRAIVAYSLRMLRNSS